MYLVIVSEVFPDEDAKLLRDVGHKVITPRSIEKGQKIIDKALKKNSNVPDAIVVDNGLKGAQFFAKALKISLQEGGEDKDIYLVVNPDIIGAIDPEYFGITGFVEAPLSSKKLLDLVGIPEGPTGERTREGETPPADKPEEGTGPREGPKGEEPSPMADKEKMTTRPEIGRASCRERV